MASALYHCLKHIPKTDYESDFRKWLKRLKLCVSHNWGILKDIQRNNVSFAFCLVFIGHWTKFYASLVRLSFATSIYLTPIIAAETTWIQRC